MLTRTSQCNVFDDQKGALGYLCTKIGGAGVRGVPGEFGQFGD